jgi:hypothetical protein
MFVVLVIQHQSECECVQMKMSSVVGPVLQGFIPPVLR